MSKVLVVQYHSEIRSLMILLLRQRGYSVAVANDLSEIRQQSLQHEIALVCLDIMTPGLDRDNPIEIFRSGDMGPSLAEAKILLTDVNGLLESTNPGSNCGADGLFAPRTSRTDKFIAEVAKLYLPPKTVPPIVHTWRLDKNELPSFLFACYLFEVNGFLTLRDRNIHKSLHFSNGWIRSASSNVESDWLGKMLLARHMISPEALNEVERALSSSGNRIGQEFIKRGFLDEKSLAKALNQQYASIAMSVFEWDGAEISLDDGEPNPAPHLLLHPFRLVLSGLNLGFNMKQVDKLLVASDQYLTPTVWTAFRFADINLTREEKHLLLSIDGQRKVEALINSSPFSPEATKKFLYTLLVMRVVVASDQPEPLPITFSRQVESDSQTLIEDQFFGQSNDVITFDDVNQEDESDPDLIDTAKPMTWREHFEILEYLAAARYLVATILFFITLSIIFLLYLRRDVANQFEAYERQLGTERTEVVLIKRPTFEKAENLLVEAQLILRERNWNGLTEARSLIGGALAIDPLFNDAINFRTSIDLTCQARDTMAQNPDEAYDILGQALKLFPENPLAQTLKGKFKQQNATQKAQ